MLGYACVDSYIIPGTRCELRDRTSRVADCTVKGGKQVRYIPAKMSVSYLHHLKEHKKLYIVH
jgi:hypothetical protein